MFENVNWMLVAMRMLVFYAPIIAAALVASPMVDYCNKFQATPSASVTTSGKVLNVVFSIVCTALLVVGFGSAFYLVSNDVVNGWLLSLL